jgi:dTDP-4-amino-4,6-dideoxygalactose transaminase
MSLVKSSPLALFGGNAVRAKAKLWPQWPIFGAAEREALNEVLESGKWWYGEQVAKFEQEFAAYHDAKYGVSCTSGTTAAEIVLQALGIGNGDEVIVPPYTFVATAGTVARMGATPIFADVDESWCLDPNAAEAAITPRTKAIMPVHFAGRCADMDRFNAVAKKHQIAVIEDACHSWGAKWRGKGTGALGLCGVFSFQASKNLNAGEGGIILSDNEELAEKCRSITNCGRIKGSPWYHHEVIGTNARLTEFAGALLRAQMTRLDDQNRLRIRNTAILNAALGKLEGLTLQPGDDRISTRVYHLYCLRIDEEKFGCSRDRVVQAALAEGLPCGGGYPEPLYKQPVFLHQRGDVDYASVKCSVTEDLCYRSGMWFQHQILLGSEDDMHDIVAIFTKIKENARALSETETKQ